MTETGERSNLAEQGNAEWQSLLSYENPQLPLYQKLDAKQKDVLVSLSSSSAAYIWDFLKKDNKGEFRSQRQEYLQTKLKGGILLDIGGHRGTMQEAAESLGARLYVSIDPNMFYKHDNLDPYKDVSADVGIVQGENTRTILINDFVLSVIARIKSGSVDGIVINGIDSEIINDPVYLAALAQEMMRILKQKGVLFGANALPLEYINERDVTPVNSVSSIKILEKN